MGLAANGGRAHILYTFVVDFFWAFFRGSRKFHELSLIMGHRIESAKIKGWHSLID